MLSSRPQLELQLLSLSRLSLSLSMLLLLAGGCGSRSALLEQQVDGDGPRCLEIEEAYIAAVDKAKSCCPECGSPQCQVVVKNRLSCYCNTYIEASNTAALQTMADLGAKWQALGCNQVVGPCPEIACIGLNGASCTSAGGGPAICRDQM